MAMARVMCRGALVLLVFFFGVALAVSVVMHSKERSRPRSMSEPTPGDEPTEAITRTCRVTLYPELCVNDLMAFPGAAAAGDAQLVSMSINASRRRVVDALSDATSSLAVQTIAADARRATAAYRDCVELLDAAAELLERCAGAMMTASAADDTSRDEDVTTWLSAALTYHDTCNDSLHEVDDDVGRIKPQMLEYLSKSNLGEHLSNSLAIFTSAVSSMHIHQFGRRRLLRTTVDTEETTLWVKDSDQRLLLAGCADIVPDMVVAADGSGTYRTISGAVDAAPDLSRRRVVIYVKAGVYVENVTVRRNKTNLMLLGDGVNKTVLVGHRNVRDDNITTFRTATLAVAGDGFVMRDMTVENQSGPEKGQAVALMVTADHAVVYRCAVLGYQDTLYAHAHRQLYRDCDVAGTVDFIVGNAAVVLQNCTLWARRPLPKQKNTVTAQGRQHTDQNTGISVHRCRLLPSPELVPVQSEYPTYLGRPWKPYARVVYMMSTMADHVHAAGWLAWNASPTGAAPDTVYYGEFQNSGPGAAVAGRVAWPGHHVMTLPDEAMDFTVGRFIAGSTWLPPTGVPFFAGLTE